jgi:CO/xanthine dehydrogenase Mo-binding subunit
MPMQRAVRVDGAEKVSGAGLYASDVRLPGLLIGFTVRSAFPHARIDSIDASEARKIHGVHAVLTAADLPQTLIGKNLHDVPLLARDRVRFVGDRVAVVAAESKEIAEEAVNAVAVKYAELPAVFDPEEALKPAAPVLHPDLKMYRHAEGREWSTLPPYPNASAQVAREKGNVEQGFAASAQIFEDVFRIPMQNHGFIEPHSCTVAIDRSGKVRLWSCIKQPFDLKEWFAFATGVDEEEVVVMPVRIGADFGGKGYILDEALAYFLARASGRPVQMVMSQNEEFIAGVHRHPAVIRIKSGVDGEGRLLARQVQILWNGGAYAGFRPGMTLNGTFRSAGVYRIPNVRITSVCAYTNQVPCGHMRAPGQPQVIFAVESHTDLVARRIGMSPVEFRERNLLRDGDEAPLGGVLRHVRAVEVLKRGAAAIGWEKAKKRGVGRGLAVSERGTGSGRAVVTIELDGQGTVTVHTGVAEVGTGSHTVLRAVVARVLSIEPDHVQVVQGDTDKGPFDVGSGGSKVTNTTGGAAFAAAQKVRERLLRLASEGELLPKEGLELRDGGFYARGQQTKGIAFRDLAGRLAQAQGGVIREVADVKSNPGAAAGYACHAVEVAVDQETGKVCINKAVVVHDVGYAVNPIGLTGQIEGGFAQGLGMGLMEEMDQDGGRPRAVNFDTYKMPCAPDIPPISIQLIENGDGPGPFGAKGIGEISATPTAPAIANAVEDAVGVRIFDLPITAEKVLQKIRQRQR